MKTQFPIQVSLALVLVMLAGCAGSSKSSSTEVNTSGSLPADDRGGRTDSSPLESWDYDSMPTPSPTKSPDHRLNEIAFKDNSTLLDSEGLAICRTTAAQIASMGNVRILVVGFSHKTEKDTELGIRRAEAVRSGLVAQGLATSRIETASFGSRFSGITDSPHPYMLTAAQGVEIWTLHD